LPLAPHYVDIKSAWVRGDRSVPYVRGKVAPKMIASAAFVEGVLIGGHGITTHVPFVTRGFDAELAIVHVPFTTLRRFTRKVAAVREIIGRHGDETDPEIGWHWRFWATLDKSGVRAEFERQILTHDADETLTTARSLFDATYDANALGRPHVFAPLKPMVHYREPTRGRTMPNWMDIAFDAHWYVDNHEDVRRGVELGTIDPYAHFSTVGIIEGRSPSRDFDPHYVQRELERCFGCYLELRDVYWLYFSLPASERPPTVAA
jgi:hypothetical protein